MPGFVFRLEALLTHRQQLEKDRQRRVAQVQQEVQVLVRLIQETQARISAENRTLGVKELTGKLDLQYIAHEKRFVGALQVKITLAVQKLAGLEQVLAGARAELLAAARARKIIEKLREKQFQRWRAQLERKEAALMDEIATQRALRGGTAGSLAFEESGTHL